MSTLTYYCHTELNLGHQTLTHGELTCMEEPLSPLHNLSLSHTGTHVCTHVHFDGQKDYNGGEDKTVSFPYGYAVRAKC